MTSAQRCQGRRSCLTGLECFSRRCPTPEYVGSNYTRISEIQGRGQVPPLVDETAQTIGVVTAILASSTVNSYFIQDIYDDGDELTSEAIYVFRPNFGGDSAPIVGDVVEFSGRVTEFAPSSRSNDLPVTELVSATGAVIKAGAGIVVPPVKSFFPRRPLSSFGSYEQDRTAARTDIVETNYECGSARESAICYYEAHEDMLLSIVEPRAVTAELRFNEIGVVSRRTRRSATATVTKKEFSSGSDDGGR